jgi:2-C-methyl-D-erythritol 4-phosphate cytidylyltransferase
VSVWAVIAAAGEGRRLGGRAKAFLPVAGAPMVARPLATLLRAGVDGVILVAPPRALEEGRAVAAEAAPGARVAVVAGGVTRQASVRAGLEAVPRDAERILVHDAARPLVTLALVAAALDALDRAAAAVVAVPERDTLKRVRDGLLVAETVSREGLWRAQTPQAFRAAVLRRAHEEALRAGVEATDDAALVERLGEPVAIVPGDERNLKVTTPEDLAIVEALLAAAGG